MNRYLKHGLIRGSIFAAGMAAFEYFSDGIFNPYKFLFHFVFFGASMGAIDYYQDKKKKKKSSKR